MSEIELTAAMLQKALQTPPIKGYIFVTDAAGIPSLISLSQIDKTHIGLSNVNNTKTQFSATRQPLVTDDSTIGYSAGSVWIFNNNAWMCVSATPESAAWTQLTGGGGGAGGAGTFNGGEAGDVGTGGLDGGGA